MFDMRYHIASIVAIFFALAIGILLGTVIQEKGIISDRQQALVKRLEDDYTALREENKKAKKQLETSQKFSSEVAPYLTENKLLGKNIAVIAVGDFDRETKKYTLSSLVQAGATVQSITTFFPSGTDINQAFTDLRRTQTGAASIEVNEYRQAIISAVIKQLTTTAPPTIIKKLNQSGLIESTGNYATQIDGVLLYISLNANVKSEDLSRLISSLKPLRIPVVGIERSDAESYSAKMSEDAGFSSVDNVETTPGQIALVAVLTGSKGNYGVKESGHQLLPSLSP